MASGEKQTSKKPATLPPSVLTNLSKLTLRTQDRTRSSRETPMEIEENGTTTVGVTADPSTAMDTSEPPDLTTVQEVWAAIERGRSRARNEIDKTNKEKTGKDKDKECKVVATENVESTTCAEEEGGEMQATVRQLRYNAERAARTIRAVKRTKELREQGRTTTEAIKEAMLRTKRGKKKIKKSPDYLQMQETFRQAVKKLKKAEEQEERQEVMRAVMEQTDTEIDVYEAMIKELEKEKEDLNRKLREVTSSLRSERTAHEITTEKCETRLKTIERMTQEYEQLLAIYNKQIVKAVKRRETDREKRTNSGTGRQEEQGPAKAEEQIKPKPPNLDQLFKMNNEQVAKYKGQMWAIQYYAWNRLPKYGAEEDSNPWTWGERVISQIRCWARRLNWEKADIDKDSEEARVEIDAAIVLYIRQTIKELLVGNASLYHFFYEQEQGNKDENNEDGDFYQILENFASRLPHRPKRITTVDGILQQDGETVDEFLGRLIPKIQEQRTGTSTEAIGKGAKEMTEILLDNCRIEYKRELVGRVGIRPAEGETTCEHRDRVIQELRQAERYLGHSVKKRRIKAYGRGVRQSWTMTQRKHVEYMMADTQIHQEEQARVQRGHTPIRHRTGYAVARAQEYRRNQGQQWDGDTESETTRGDESEDGERMPQFRDGAWRL